MKVIVIQEKELENLKISILSEIEHMLKAHIGTEDSLITRAEAAKILKISLPTLHKLTIKNQIPVYKTGGVIRYKRKELLASFKRVNFTI